MNWLNDTFAAHLQERASKEGTKARILVICDNLDAHTYSGFLDGLKALGAERNLLGNSYSFHIYHITGIYAIIYYVHYIM